MTKAKSSSTSPQWTAVQRGSMNMDEFTGVLCGERCDLVFKGRVLQFVFFFTGLIGQNIWGKIGELGPWA